MPDISNSPFDALLDQYIDPVRIPDEDLYRCINSPEMRESVKNIGKLGLDRLKEFEIVQEVRRRCEQDLWFLGKYFLWDTDVASGGSLSIEENFMCEHVHRRVADLFVKKDKTKRIGEQDWRKDRLLLYPRGTGKSAWDRYDTVQWVLNFPDIRILYLTAEQDLAEGFVKETKNHFLLRDEDPSLMNLYFPEYCFAEKDAGVADKLICPLWAAKNIVRKEPTVWGSSILSTLSGKHFESIKADDAVGDGNSNTEEMCAKIESKFNLKRKMLLPTGYVDKIGTRYADEDMYGVDLEKNVGELEKTSGPCWERIDNKTTGLIVLIGRSIVIKPEVLLRLEQEGKPATYHEAGPAGCDLLFPEHHPYNWCLLEYGKNEKIFEGQQNQNPRSAASVIFDLPLLKRHTVPFDQLPQRGPISQTWDFAFSKKKGRDYSTASSCIWNDKGHFYVHDLIRARFTPTGLAKAVVDFAMKWRPFVIGIEDCAGSRLLEPSILAEAEKTKRPDIIELCRHIDWYKPDNQKDAKIIRMGSLHPWLTSDRMWIANYVPFLDILYSEFEKCLTSHHHDDIPDVLAYQLRFAPKMQSLIETKDIETWSSSDATWNLLFGGGGELYGGMQGNDCDPFGRLGFGGLPSPILVVNEEPEEMRAETPYDGMPAILGSGLFG